jgi:hypothetical protein
LSKRLTAPSGWSPPAFHESRGLAGERPDNGDDGVKLDGRELVARKSEFLSIMAADFHSSNKNAKGEAEAEYNIKGDINAARELFAKWPTPVFVSDFSTGLRVLSDWKTLASS